MYLDLHRIDLNLLAVFHCVYPHQSVAAAAKELAMSASAVRTRLRVAITLINRSQDNLSYR
ncbi:helix-turn-helix domain-containing protein [Pectobacterium parmentieri]|uniref:helix-turn-helix domain-containing protein n=1 Tax=Pectobacterium parmentieri TaxID=1905730 RepID=UPI000B12DB12